MVQQPQLQRSSRIFKQRTVFEAHHNAGDAPCEARHEQTVVMLRVMLLVSGLAGGVACIVPTSQHALQLAARRAALPPAGAFSLSAVSQSKISRSKVVMVPPLRAPPCARPA